MSLARILDSEDPSLYDVRSKAPGPQGSLPITPEMLIRQPSGDLFGWSQNAGMGWDPAALGGKEFLILSTHGGIRAADGTPVALGYHTGHWEVGLLMEAAAEELKSLGAIPFAGYCTDPCDGRTQGTTGMFDSLPYRNDAASVFRRLIRSLPTRSGVIGVATCDKGLPAMMMALAGIARSAVRAGARRRHAAGRGGRGRRQGAVHRRALRPRPDDPGGGRRRALPRLRHARRRLPVSGHRGHLAGGRRGAGHVAAALRAGALRAAHLARHGAPLGPRRRWRWKRAASPCATSSPRPRVRNAMVVHAAFGGSTNLILHLPAIAHAAGLPRPTVDDWTRVNRQVPRLVDALPNGPQDAPHRAGLPGRRRARSDAAPAPRGPARDRRPDGQRRNARRRARLVGAIRTARGAAARAARARRRRSRRRHHGPGRARAAAG